MIVQTRGDQLWLIRQVDHQFLAGRLAEAWGALPFAQPSNALVRAAFEHDEGWRTWEEQPTIDPRTRLPYQFTDMPVEEHLTFYREGVEAAVAKDLYAGLLVNMHCVGLYNGRYGKIDVLPAKPRSSTEQAVIQKFTRELEQQQALLRKELQIPTDAAALWTAYLLLQIFDLLSLYFCMGPLRERTIKPVPTVTLGETREVKLAPLDETRLAVTPYPFRPNPVYPMIAARIVPNRPYASDADFQDVYSRAKEQVLSFEIVPGE